MALKRIVSAFSGAASRGALVAMLAISPARAEPVPIAVLDFQYSDTSGEAKDQTADHERRRQGFVRELRRDLEQSGAYRVVALDCGGPPCTVAELLPQELFDAAKKAGARLVLYGGVHKMSTLVQWARVQLVDVEKNKVLDDRHLSFRGDSDDAWRRAEQFVAKQIIGQRLGETK